MAAPYHLSEQGFVKVPQRILNIAYNIADEACNGGGLDADDYLQIVNFLRTRAGLSAVEELQELQELVPTEDDVD